MKSSAKLFRVAAMLALLSASACVRRRPSAAIQAPPSTTRPSIVQGALTAPGSPPFHLKAVITERGDPTSKTEVEIFWEAPDEWRRTIKSETEFSQTLIVNHDRISEQDSGDYFPLWSQTLAVAMVDPTSILQAYKPGDLLLTKANGASDESGAIHFPGNASMVATGPYGLHESVGAAGRHVDFLNYQYFHEVRVARFLSYKIDPGDSYQARIVELDDLDHNPDPMLFHVAHPTERKEQIQSVVLADAELRSRALQSPDVIWPQVLDGLVTGQTSYYISTDRSGQVREVLPLSVMAERADDSARRQIMQWKFKPLLKNGVPVQIEGVLKFDFNTRAYGPPEPLSDEEARKLASNIVEPVFPPGVASGETFTIRIAVDINGDVIEWIAGDGAHELYQPCADALRKWHFRPIMENGEARPYRAQIVCRVP